MREPLSLAGEGVIDVKSIVSNDFLLISKNCEVITLMRYFRKNLFKF